MKTNTFFTWCWFIWFTLCLAFYHSLNFDYIDECLTLAMILFTFAKLGKLRNQRAKKEMAIYIGIMVFYLIYSLLMAVNVSVSVYMDLQQQMRPYMVFYCSWLLAPQFTKRQLKWINRVMVSTLLVSLWLLFSGTGAAAFTQENNPIFGQMACVACMMWYYSKPQTRKSMVTAIIILSFGLITSKSKFFGEYIAFVAIFIFLHRKIRLFSFKRIIQLSALAGVIIFFTWTKFNAYYVEGFDTEVSGRMARPETYKTALTIIFKDYFPLGPGLGTFATNAVAVYYSPLYYKYNLDEVWGLSPKLPMFIADAYYPTLAEYGMVGVILFVVFWRLRWREVQKISDVRYYKVAVMSIMALLLESVADSSYLSGKGMGYFMLLGMCLGTLQWRRTPS